MQSHYIDIDDINTLKEVTFNYEVDSIFTDFPFKYLIDSSSDKVSLLLDILGHFSNSSKFWQNRGDSLCCSIEFALTNISYFTKNKDRHILYKLIQFLNGIFVRVKSVSAINLQIDTSRICDLIIPLLKNDKLKYSSVILLTSMLSMQEIIFQDPAIVDYCISQCFISLESERKELPPLVVASLRAFPRLLLSRRNVLYHWLYRDCPQLLEQISNKTQVLLDCVILAYETRDGTNFELTNVYRHKISIFYRMLKNKTFRKSIMIIFNYMVIDFVSLGVLPIMGNRIKGIEFETNEKQDWFYDNMVIIINYLRCLYCPNEIDKEDVRKCIVNRCLKPPYSPAILKSLCLLYPLFCHSRQNREVVLVGNSILDAAEQCSYFCEILTYHLLQLQWFLSSNRPILKATALGVYLVNCKSDGIILRALKATNTTELLVNYLLDGMDTKAAERAVHLLPQMQCLKTAIILKQKLPTSIQSQTSLSYFFKAKPALPESEREGVFFCGMMSKILPVLNQRDAFIGTCGYSSKLLGKFRNCSGAIKAFILNESCIARMYDAASNADEDVALSAITMLTIFMKLQRRHLIEIIKTTPVDFRNLLQGSGTRLLKALNVLSLFQTYSTTRYIISIPEEQILNLYQCLLRLQCEQIYSKIFMILMKLQKTYPFLAYLSSTILYVELHSCSYKTESHTQQFLIFLSDWLQKMARDEISFYDSLQNTNTFLLSLPQSHEIQTILELLQKCSAEYSQDYQI